MADVNETKPELAPNAPKRSPNYPALGPTEALVKGEKIWKEAKRNSMSVELVYKYLGYKAKNGASIPVVAALKAYGILVKASNGEMRISDEAHMIYIAPEDLPERGMMVRELAMRPALFKEVLAKFPEGLPGDSLLRFKLMQDWEFTNQPAADTFIKSLRDAVAITRLDSGQEIADTGSEVNAEEPPVMDTKPTITTPPAQSFPRPSPPSAVPSNAPVQARTWDLGGGAMVALSLPFRLSQQNVARLRKYVEALATEAAIAWEDDPPVGKGE